MSQTDWLQSLVSVWSACHVADHSLTVATAVTLLARTQSISSQSPAPALNQPFIPVTVDTRNWIFVRLFFPRLVSPLARCVDKMEIPREIRIHNIYCVNLAYYGTARHKCPKHNVRRNSYPS